MTLSYTRLIALVGFCRIFLLMTSNGDWSTFDLGHEPFPPNALWLHFQSKSQRGQSPFYKNWKTSDDS